MSDMGAMNSKQRRAAKRRERREARITICEPICVECGKLAERVKGDRLYPNRPDLHPKSYFLCVCGAYVGCHPYTRLSLGRPAGPLTRQARNEAHATFDPLWRAKMAREGLPQHEAREAGYVWLAQQMGMEPGRCHIAWMTAEEARRVVEICAPYTARAA